MRSKSGGLGSHDRVRTRAYVVVLRQGNVMETDTPNRRATRVLSFESNNERGLSAAGEKLHSGACKFSPAAESPRSYCRLNRTMNADFAPPGKICMHLNAVFLRRRKVRVHSSIQTTVVRFKRQYECQSAPPEPSKISRQMLNFGGLFRQLLHAFL